MNKLRTTKHIRSTEVTASKSMIITLAHLYSSTSPNMNERSKVHSWNTDVTERVVLRKEKDVAID